MSRNIGSTSCRECGGPVVLDEAPRKSTVTDTGAYSNEYSSLMVANGHCHVCFALYLAWVEWSLRRAQWDAEPGELGFFDLSYQFAFNDEPSDMDLPIFVTTTGPNGDPIRIGVYDQEDIKHDYWHSGEWAAEAQAHWRARKEEVLKTQSVHPTLPEHMVAAIYLDELTQGQHLAGASLAWPIKSLPPELRSCLPPHVLDRSGYGTFFTVHRTGNKDMDQWPSANTVILLPEGWVLCSHCHQT